MESFAFKQFTVSHAKSAMKVNTDGVLLAAWVNLPSSTPPDIPGEKLQINEIGTCPQVILDIGTGTGVISLILAQRFSESIPLGAEIKITGIDIDPLSIEDAGDNFRVSPWRDLLECEAISLQEYLKRENCSEKFSLIISNPPYFTNSLKSPSQRRSAARHNDSLPLHILIQSAAQTLKKDGVLALILPVEEGKKAISFAEENLLSLNRLCRIKTTSQKSEKRYLLEFIKTGKSSNGNSNKNSNPIANADMAIEELIIQNIDGTYTEQYCNIVSKYYSKNLRKAVQKVKIPLP